ncbi:MAG: hypothetical protein V2A76_02100, partial [Planctomycetota bacterium]
EAFGRGSVSCGVVWGRFALSVSLWLVAVSFVLSNDTEEHSVPPLVCILDVQWEFHPTWNVAQSFAVAPGIACFNKSEEYAHGGFSLQECLTPDILVEQSGDHAVRASIVSITWRGLRCFVEAKSGAGKVVADLRLEKPAGPSIVAATKPVENDGSVSLVLAGDEHEAANLVLVLLDEAGNILAQKPTRVGADA